MLKDSNANKIFLIILVLVLALSFSLFKGWERRGIEQRGEQHIDFQTGDSLHVSTISNNIIIEVDENQKQATLSLGSNDKEQLKVSKQGSLITVSVSPIKRWFLRFFSYDSSPLIITLPGRTLEMLEISSTSGDITLMHPLEARIINISGISSEIDFLSLLATDQIGIHTTSGEISGKDASSEGIAEFSSTSGEIEVQHISGDGIIIKGVSSGIEAEIQLPEQGSVEVHTTSGEIDLDLRKSKNLQIMVSTISGEIEFNDKEQAGNKASLKTGDGRNPVTIASVSGEIDLLY
ncbi:MAG: DUF4097 family beta strand repeat-containing protein [Sphaerochaetaceae bacterium]